MATAPKAKPEGTKKEAKKAGRPTAPPVEPIVGLGGENGPKVQADTAARVMNTLGEDLAADNKVSTDGDRVWIPAAKGGKVLVKYNAEFGYFEIRLQDPKAEDDVKAVKGARYVYAKTAAKLGVVGAVALLRAKVYEVGALAKTA